MRILVDVRCLGWVVRGIGRYTRTLVEELVAAEVEVVCLFNSLRGRLPEAVRSLPPAATRWVTRLPERLPRRLGGWLFERLAAPRAVRGAAVDLWHGPDYTVPPALPCPRVATVHDVSWLTHPELYPAALRSRLEAGVPALQSAALLVTDSEHSRLTMAEHLGVPASRILVCPLFRLAGFRPEAPEDEGIRLRATWGLSPETPYFLCLGAKEARKNLPLLLEAFAALPEPWRQRARLVMAGPPFRPGDPGFERLQQLGDRVLDVGYLAEELLPAAHRQARALVVPSITEGFGVPLLETMACGTAALVSDGGALPEVGGEACRVLPARTPEVWTEAMHELLEDPSMARRLGQRGPARAREFSPERRLPDLLRGYRALLAAPAPAPGGPGGGR